MGDQGIGMQRFLTTEQQQEEDEWLQSVQAEADADPRNRYWVGAFAIPICSALHTAYDDI